MPHVTFDGDEDNVVSGSYSTGTGPVLRSRAMEVTKISFAKGRGAHEHAHPEEQVMYVLEGVLEVDVRRRDLRSCTPARRRSTRPTCRTG